MKRMLAYLGLFLVHLGSAAAAQSTPIEPPQAGVYLYRRHCANCHGLDGRGNGPAAAWLAAEPRDLRSGWMAQLPPDALIDRILAGRSLRLEFDPQAMRQRAADVDAVVTHLERLASVEWKNVEPGWKLYIERCEACHGPYGRPAPAPAGSESSVRDLADPRYQHDTADTEMVQAIQHGRRGMPALVPRLERPEAVQILQFVRLLSRGFEIYSEACAACHGDDGRGASSPSDTMDTPSIVFDRAYFERVDREALLVKAWHMVGEHQPRMPHFEEDLSRDDVRRILQYLGAITTRLPATGSTAGSAAHPSR